MSLIDIAKITPNGMEKVVGTSTLFVKTHSPIILTSVGIAGVVTAAVLASRASRRLDPIIDKTKADLATAREKKHTLTAEEYSSADHAKSLIKVYGRTSWDLCRLYSTSVTLGGLSILAIIGAHNILNKRYVTTAALLKTTEQAFTEYRKQVAETIGEDAEFDIRRGIKEDIVEGEDGKSGPVISFSKHGGSQYAQVFGPAQSSWQKNPEYNTMFLNAEEDYATQRLRKFGHLFLGDVYKRLGMKDTQAGQIVGWRIGQGDDFVRFERIETGNPDEVLIDFNVAGTILHAIPEI